MIHVQTCFVHLIQSYSVTQFAIRYLLSSNYSLLEHFHNQSGIFQLDSELLEPWHVTRGDLLGFVITEPGSPSVFQMEEVRNISFVVAWNYEH